MRNPGKGRLLTFEPSRGNWRKNLGTDIRNGSVKKYPIIGIPFGLRPHSIPIMGNDTVNGILPDFLLAHLPFSEAPYNLCYAIMGALSLLLFRAFKKFVHVVLGDYIRPKMRVKQVLFRLFAFPARMIHRSRQYTYNLYCRQKELKPLIRWMNH